MQSSRSAYGIDASGHLLYEQTMHPGAKKDVPNLFRFGLRMELPKAFNQVDYYGRGPVESYPDRRHSQHFGHYTGTVEDQFYPYIRPPRDGAKG